MDKKPVTILRDAEGKAVGILIETLDERFALELHPIDGGKKYTWPDAMARLKELGKDGFNEKQGKIIAVYHEEIDAALEEAGGDKLGWEWAVGEYTGSHAWFYRPTYGALSISNKYNSSQVRPLLASKQIESLIGPRRLSGAAEILVPEGIATAEEIARTIYTLKDMAYSYEIHGSNITVTDIITYHNQRETVIHASEFANWFVKRMDNVLKGQGIKDSIE